MCKCSQNAIRHIVFEFTRIKSILWFHYPVDEKSLTCIKYNNVSNIAGVSFKSDIAAKRNDRG